MIAKVVIVSMLPLLAGCSHAVKVQNPETGEIVQCENEPLWFETKSWLFKTVGQPLRITNAPRPTSARGGEGWTKFIC